MALAIFSFPPVPIAIPSRRLSNSVRMLNIMKIRAAIAVYSGVIIFVPGA